MKILVAFGVSETYPLAIDHATLPDVKKDSVKIPVFCIDVKSDDELQNFKHQLHNLVDMIDLTDLKCSTNRH